MVKNAMIDDERDRHHCGSKPFFAILLCPWKNTLWYFPLLGGLRKQSHKF